MSDTREVMKEFRFLDEKRQQAGLTPAEEQQWYALAQSLGVDVQGAYPPDSYANGYIATDGLWYPYPEGYDPNAAADPNAAYVSGEDAAQGYAQPDGSGDPAGFPMGEEEGAQAY